MQSDLRELLKRVKRIEIITRKRVRELFGGEYKSAFKGRGLEFSEVREYTPGDDVRLIDWNVTARMNHPYVKVFTEERELTLWLVVDVSASMRFGAPPRTKRYLAGELCGVFAFSAMVNNDRIGLLLFDDDVRLVIPPAKGRRHCLRVIREVLEYPLSRRDTRIVRALDYLLKIQRKMATVVVISDLRDDAFVGAKVVPVFSKRYDPVVLLVEDPRERKGCGGLVHISSAEWGTEWWGVWSTKVWERMYDKWKTTVKDFLVEAGVDVVEISTDQPWEASLRRFFEKRMRRRAV